jgi:hypothetical protein
VILQLQSGEVPFKLAGGYPILVEGYVEALNELRFVLDTDVPHSVADRKLVRILYCRMIRTGRRFGCRNPIRGVTCVSLICDRKGYLSS